MTNYETTPQEHKQGTALAVRELELIDGEVIDAADVKDAHRIDAEFVEQIHEKTVDFIEEYSPTVVDGNKVQLSPEAEQDFESMFIDELMQRLADGTLKEHELSEASAVPEVFAEGWQRNGVSYELGNEKLKNIAAVAGNLVKAIAVLDHVIPEAKDGSTDDKRDSVSGFVRDAATSKAASRYIDSADYYFDQLDPETADKARDAMEQIDARAHQSWPKMDGHLVGEQPMRWL